jgi:hypothetical protein
MGIGSDWSPSGSKNLLGELKVARLVSQAQGGVFGDREIVSMATRQAAAILQWDKLLGTLEGGKRADLLVIDGKSGDPYAALLQAKETAIRLVMINGVPRYGMPSLMGRLGAAGEGIRVGGRSRTVFLRQATADPVVAAIPLGEARNTLQDAFRRLPELARKLEQPPPAAPRLALGRPAAPVWLLALDEIEDTGVDLRPRLPLPGRSAPTGASRAVTRAAAPLSTILEPMDLDPLTVADDGKFLQRIAGQKNLPAFLRTDLATLY